jgi:hypothetical protein
MKCSLCDDDFSKELEQKMEECLSVPDPKCHGSYKNPTWCEKHDQTVERCNRKRSVPDPIPPYTEEDEELFGELNYHEMLKFWKLTARLPTLYRLAAGYMAERDTARADAGCIAKYRDQYFRERDEARAALRELVDADDGNEMPSPRMSAAWRNAERVLGESTDAK